MFCSSLRLPSSVTSATFGVWVGVESSSLLLLVQNMSIFQRILSEVVVSCWLSAVRAAEWIAVSNCRCECVPESVCVCECV